MDKLKIRFSDFNVRSKLIVLIGTFLSGILILGIAAQLLFNSSRTINILINSEKVFIENFDAGIEHLYKYELSGNSNNLDEAEKHLNHAVLMAYSFSKIDSIVNTSKKKEWIPYLYNIYKEGVNHDVGKIKLFGNQIKFICKFNPNLIKELQLEAYQVSKIGKNIIEKVNYYRANNTNQTLVELHTTFDEVHAYSKSFASSLYEISDYFNRFLYWSIAILVALLGVIITYISLKISNSISDPINKLSSNFKLVSKGNLKSSIDIIAKNEIGDLSRAFMEIQIGLQEIISYTKRIAQGDFVETITPKSEEDELTPALNEMAAKLKAAKIRNEKESWLQKGISELDDIMRGNYSVRELSDRVINYLSNFLEVEMGAVFVYDEELKHLEFTGSVGINTKKVEEKIKVGEGLIGKVAKTNTMQILNPKKEYHKTYSATGEMMPENIYLLPMQYDNRPQAVIELAPLNKLSEIKIEYLKLIAERISVNMGAAVARFRSNELLKTTLEQAKTLQYREEQLNKQLEENNIIQEKLTREKALLDSMLKIIPDYIHFKDIDGKFLRISESLTALFNVNNSNELIGKSDYDLYDTREAKKYADEEQKIIKEGEGFVDKINENIDKNGNKNWSSVTKLPMYDDTGKCIGTFGISKDITEIKNLEIAIKSQNEELHTNQEKLKTTIEEMHVVQNELEREKVLMDSLLSSTPDAIYFKDLESKFIKVSSSMPLLFNLQKPEELYGKSDFDFFTKEHALPSYNDEQRIIKTKKPIIGKVEKDTFKDGSVRYVSSTKMPLINKKGDVLGTFGISRDITKIKKLELDIKERNEKLNAQQEELKTINEELKAQEEELRVANEELAEQTKVLAESEKNLQVQQEELRVTNEELEAKTKELEHRQKEISQKNNNLVITQKELEQKAQELKLASQYKSEFLANMSHELRTPLNSMLILSKLLGNNKKGNLTEDQIKSVNIIHKSGNDLLELINEILDLSKIEAGKMTFEFEQVRISEIIAELEQGFKPVAENKGLDFEIDKVDKFPGKIYTDKQRLQQIIKNLLSNAFKFTNSGTIRVNFGLTKSKTVFTNSKLNSENTCFISVEDTGVGIPKDKLDAIFEAFQQVDGSISRKFGGTGLGLSISKQIISVFGGEIQVESVEGVGSSFIIYLPLDKKLINTKSESKIETKKETNQEKKVKVEESKLKEVFNSEVKIPFFVADDRNEAKDGPLVLIVYNEKEKARKMIELCHKRKFKAVAAESIVDGIILAENYLPKAIIISAELNNSDDLKQLKENITTSRLPLHMISRIEDSVLENIEELKTPASDDLQNVSKNIEHKLNKEFNQVLVVEDDPATRESIQLLFENKNILIHEAKTGQQAYDMISARPFDCIILDLGLPDFSGDELLKKLNSNKIPIPNVIIHTARELDSKELRKLRKYSDSIVIKGIKSDERLMDEVTLFLHQVKNTVLDATPDENHKDVDEPGFKGKKVLIVDDDIRNIFALAQILEEKEIEILEAENGEVAIDVLKQNPDIDLVLMDIMMPVMNGYDAMSEIRKTPEIEHVPIITLTAKAMKEDYQKAIDSGANDYISKPVDTDKLLSLLKIWLF